jgi:hypothetical protein
MKTLFKALLCVSIFSITFASITLLCDRENPKINSWDESKKGTN